MFTNLPAGHWILGTAMQESVLMLLFDVVALKNPGAHASHLGWVVLDPITMVYLPGGHLVWPMHWSIRQPDGKQRNGK